MTRDAILALVQANTGRTDKDTVSNTSIDFAILNLSQKHPFDQLRTQADVSIVANDLSMSLAAAADQIVEIRLLDLSSPTMSYPMSLRRKTWFVERFPYPTGSTVTGRPFFCYRDGSTLYFDRKSNASYTVRYTYFSYASFASGSTDAAITNADECLAAYATSRVYASIQMYQDSMFWMNEYNRLARDLVNAKQREIGVQVIAEQWQNQPPVNSNAPWLDPFQGLKS